VNPAALALGPGSDDFFRIVSHALAQEWFGESMYLSDAAAVGMGEGLPEYATVVIDEARNGHEARRKRVTEYLRRYDEALKAAAETPLGAITTTDAAGSRRIALAKAPLFFIALEDVCGEGPMHTGIANMLAAQRGREAGYADLRSALERSCSRDFASMFRLWLNGKGIPEDFRLRYQGHAVGESAELRETRFEVSRRNREGNDLDR
jgi:aminopeptidase N